MELPRETVEVLIILKPGGVMLRKGPHVQTWYLPRDIHVTPGHTRRVLLLLSDTVHQLVGVMEFLREDLRLILDLIVLQMEVKVHRIQVDRDSLHLHLEVQELLELLLEYYQEITMVGIKDPSESLEDREVLLLIQDMGQHLALDMEVQQPIVTKEIMEDLMEILDHQVGTLDPVLMEHQVAAQD